MSELLMSNNFHPLSSTDSNLIENSWSGFGLTPDLPRRDMILSSRSPSASSSDSMDSLSTIIDQGSRGKIQNYYIMTWSKIESKRWQVGQTDFILNCLKICAKPNNSNFSKP